LAYFKVFNTFIQFSLGQITQINFSFIDFIKDFYFLIPLNLVFLNVFIFAIYVFLAILSKKKFGQKTLLLLHSFMETQRKTRLLRSGLFLSLLLINVVGINFASYLAKHPRESWWNSQKYSLDCGLAGHIYGELHQFLTGEVKTIFAKEGKINDDEKMKIASLPKTTNKIDLIKSYLSAIKNNKENIKEQKISKLPLNPHIIIYQLESVGAWALKQNPSPMPYLKELMEKNITTSHFFSNSCQTVNAEFSAVCSFVSDSSNPISFHEKNNNLNCLPSILKNEYGYTTKIFHANVASFWNRDKLAEKWGFDEAYFTPYFRQKESDARVITTMIRKIKESGKPTFNYIIGFTSHDPHNQELINYQARKNNIVIKPYALPLNNSSLNVIIEEKTIRNYFGFLKEVDNNIKNLYGNLQKNNLLDKTVVIIYGDHRYYDFPIDSLENFYNYNEVPFVVTVPGKQESIIAKNFASQIDIAPTILNILQGEEYKKTPEFIENSVFSKNHPDNILSKCLGEIIYADDQQVIIGNSKTNLYRNFYSKENLSGENVEKNIEILKNLVKVSDEVIYTDTLFEE
jgi:phosphoglycerol transferase MdoB-like AlkP superfamily enzyme